MLHLLHSVVFSWGGEGYHSLILHQCSDLPPDEHRIINDLNQKINSALLFMVRIAHDVGTIKFVNVPVNS